MRYEKAWLIVRLSIVVWLCCSFSVPAGSTDDKKKEPYAKVSRPSAKWGAADEERGVQLFLKEEGFVAEEDSMEVILRLEIRGEDVANIAANEQHLKTAHYSAGGWSPAAKDDDDVGGTSPWPWMILEVTFLPPGPGKYEVGPFSLKFNGKKLTSNSVTIELPVDKEARYRKTTKRLTHEPQKPLSLVLHPAPFNTMKLAIEGNFEPYITNESKSVGSDLILYWGQIWIEYVWSSDVPGTFTVGPFGLNFADQKLVSNSLSIQVPPKK